MEVKGGGAYKIRLSTLSQKLFPLWVKFDYFTFWKTTTFASFTGHLVYILYNTKIVSFVGQMNEECTPILLFGRRQILHLLRVTLYLSNLFCFDICYEFNSFVYRIDTIFDSIFYDESNKNKVYNC